MSIIYDYLKQIQNPKEAKPASPAAAPAAASPAPQILRSFLKWKVAVWVLGCLLLAAGLFFFFPKAKKSAAKLYPIPTQAPRPEVVDDGYMLEGIIYNPSKPFAIINGKMLEAGQQIGDYEVVQITPETVLLKNPKDGTSRTVHL